MGSLADMPGADLLRALARTETSGMLRVGDANPAWVALAHGAIVIAGATGGPTLAAELRRRGAIDSTVLREAEARGAHHDLSLLSELVRNGVDQALLDTVRHHTVGAVLQILLPSSEPFAFQPGPPIAVGCQVSFPVESILADAHERLDQWAVIAETVPSTQLVFRPRRRLDTPLQEVTICRDDWEVLAVLDGRRTVAQVIAATGRGSFEVLSALHRLVNGGMVDTRSGQGSVGRPDR